MAACGQLSTGRMNTWDRAAQRRLGDGVYRKTERPRATATSYVDHRIKEDGGEGNGAACRSASHVLPFQYRTLELSRTSFATHTTPHNRNHNHNTHFYPLSSLFQREGRGGWARLDRMFGITFHRVRMGNLCFYCLALLTMPLASLFDYAWTWYFIFVFYSPPTILKRPQTSRPVRYMSLPRFNS